jgi:hypothetical protein
MDIKYFTSTNKSSPESFGWFSWEFQSFDADNGSIFVDWVINIWQVLEGRSLSDSTELVINWTVANANISIIVAQIWNGNATQMGADGWAYQDGGFTGWSEDDFRALVKNGFNWVIIFLLDLFGSKSSDEDRGTVPDNLDDFGRWQFRDIDLHVGVPVVSGPSGESSNGGDAIESGKVEHTGIVDCTEGVQLGSSDFGLVFVMDSVFVEPVVDGGLEIDVITEVSRTSRCDKELSLIWYRVESV